MVFPFTGARGRKARAGFFLGAAFLVGTAPAADGKEASPCDIRYASDGAIQWTCHKLARNESLESLFGERWQDVARFNRIDRRHALPGVGLKIPERLEDVEDFAPVPAELAYDFPDEDPKYILIDLTEQYLGAYEKGRLVFSSPITSGKSRYITPPGEYRIDAYSGRHESSLYKIEGTDLPYPMHYALRFLVNEREVEYWIHGRDMPGYPASHGCVGLYDEDMQKEYFGEPEYPLMDTARKLYEWAIGPHRVEDGIHYLKKGPRMLIIGEPPDGIDHSPNMAPGP
ncbi:L,D-transpeptidase [Geotalea sp. SG265]|uniref:L,D-transpeptidase n=1 Tax=Geotalea sp. SG265 TaxID=2922867 RepID=UPI001FAF5432|nr:L,D-transpeptidase [Geotalea sp. SG265]